jgi:hypothetical protein
MTTNESSSDPYRTSMSDTAMATGRGEGGLGEQSDQPPLSPDEAAGILTAVTVRRRSRLLKTRWMRQGQSRMIRFCRSTQATAVRTTIR